jgi:hypothetical protein
VFTASYLDVIVKKQFHSVMPESSHSYLQYLKLITLPESLLIGPAIRNVFLPVVTYWRIFPGPKPYFEKCRTCRNAAVKVGQDCCNCLKLESS